MSSSFSSFVKGVLVGLGIGLLTAPKSGEDTRRDIQVKMDELKDQGKDLSHLAV